ncbi:50S ribosomal protein L4 [Verruconis gallopava]|uniref:Large ribosomal subunit protein uL4m n=1 Tax=Verruconis gallopava TaxID=253628 RepID=A0A0D1YHF4_9PEZI|nr:50S ribosomal protein L4 [Verruconis gallopava]KIW00277.1 50S ribosomal protein L4 [Verruconis gallopava]
MASRHCASAMRGGQLTIRCRKASEMQTGRRICIRYMSTALSSGTNTSSSVSSDTLPPPPPPSAKVKKGLIIPNAIPSHILPTQDVYTTVYSFPSLEPLRVESYPHTHLSVPLRRDILHRAVIYEGDRSRQGTANTKWRSEVHGSGIKIRPQKGTGHARLGDKKSPMLRGGGVAHGPKPRSFATELPKKIYHKAWRMALSYRYRRGQLIVVDELGVPTDIPKEDRGYWLRWALDGLGWGRNGDGHSFFITQGKGEFAEALDSCVRYGRLRTASEVDVKNLLEMKRLVVERRALRQMLIEHQADLQLPLVRSPKGITTSSNGSDVPQAVKNVSELEMRRAVAEAKARSGLSHSADDFSAAAANAAAAAAVSSAVSGMNTLSMDEVDAAAAAEAHELRDEGEDLIADEYVEDDEFDDEEVEELARELDEKSR